MRALHAFQELALLNLKRSLAAGHRRPVLQAPTGAGKTMVASAMVEGALRKGRRLIFTVPALTLIDQTVAAFEAEGVDPRLIGVLQADHPRTNWGCPIQVASVQTLLRRVIPPADVVVIDECHRKFDLYERWMRQEGWQDVPFVGLSATPWTRGLGLVFDDLIIAATTKDLIDQGYLSPFKVYAPSHPDLRGVKTVAGDYHEGQLSEVMSQKTIVADVVATWRELGEERQTLCFCVDRAHARKVADEFEDAGITTAYVDMNTSREEREEVRDAFQSGRTRIVCNVGVLTTGVDWDVRALILARPTKSEMLFVQIVGRALRTAPGKDHALILDHSDTTLRLGMVTDIHHEHLDDGKPLKKAERLKPVRKPHECPQCNFLMGATTWECPSCGFKAQRQSDVEVINGRLAALRGHLDTGPAMKRRWHAELQYLATQRNKSDKWVLAMYRSKFNEWPRDRFVVGVHAGAEVINYVRSRNIAYARRIAKERRATA